jgi:hypothetical protein
MHKKQLESMMRFFNGTRPMGITYGRHSRDNADDIKVFLYQ